MTGIKELEREEKAWVNGFLIGLTLASIIIGIGYLFTSAFMIEWFGVCSRC